jgi:chemotaxis protein histidine kinase CheA/ActR/RegA family two-component response regulator
LLDREDVESLREEIAEGHAALADTLAGLRDAPPSSPLGEEARRVYGEQLKNIVLGARLVGLNSLADAVSLIENNLQELGSQQERKAAVCDLLGQWPMLLLNHLSAPTESEAIDRIIDYLRHPSWTSPLGEAACEQLRKRFAQEYGVEFPLEPIEVADQATSLERAAATYMSDEGMGWVDGSGSAEPQPPTPLAESNEWPTAVSMEERPPATSGMQNDEAPLTTSAHPPELASLGDDNAVPTRELSGSPTDAPGNDDDSVEAAHEETQTVAVEPSGGESQVQDDMLAALRAEIDDVRRDLEHSLTTFATAESDDPALARAVEQYEAIVERLWTTCGVVGLSGLQDICTFISSNLLELAGEEQRDRGSARSHFTAWPGLVLGYLKNPCDETACKALVRHVQASGWPSPLSDDAARTLLQKLIERPSLKEAEFDVDTRPLAAQDEDVSLELPEDVNQETLDAFLQEAPFQATELSGAVQRIYDRTASRNDIKLAQRIAHTLKGTAHLTGIRGIATLTHHIEDILEFLADHEVAPPRALTEALVESVDCLEAMVDTVTQGLPAPPNALAVLQRVLDWANRIDSGALERDTTETDSATPTPTVETTAGHAPPISGTQAGEGTAAAQPVLRVATTAVDEMLRLVGELSMSINQIQDRYRRALEHVRSLREQDDLLQQRVFEIEDLVDVRGVGVMQGRLQRTGTHDAAFDPLELNEYNELHSVTQSVTEAASDARELGVTVQEELASLEDLVVRQLRLQKLLQQAVMGTRMVPVRNLVPRLQRTVRQTCRMTDKQARMEVTGEDSLIDGEVLQKLADPLMHILRNAIDHGIESPEERARLGKSESGHIDLNFSRMGNAIIVRCVDDGRGLDYDRIREVAVAQGLITPHGDYGQRELARLVFTPGFSTHATATHTSGRGIGLDVVYSAVAAMKGSVEIEADEGQGTAITLRLPVSLVTGHVLLVRLGAELYGVPTTNLEQILAAGTFTFEFGDNGPALRRGENEVYPACSLAALLNVPVENGEDYQTRPALVVRADAGATAVAVDRVVDGLDLVIKSMGRYVKDVPGVLGAAILGDGTVVPVLDIPELLRAPVMARTVPIGAEETEMQVASTARRVLIVDDSLGARRSLSQLVRDAGYEAVLAKDGLEAVDLVHARPPAIALVDLEMPRMNGLEFTAHVRADEDIKDLPIIVITSRSTEKHRKQATLAGANAYVTKPFDETELLDLIEATLARGGAAARAS